ncbi:unnamed protein product [Miscanthus lutarioriparius]|uniref:F-box domain-containing protein n=1 Tax=Miscanthus lutarioriparius TaxID=422564 RepID=A0A811RG55_9POAL|nr:unnamed protein product [Miscanthus lutarioriparius]
MAADSDLGAEALPNEVVVTEILARLPAKSVGRFRCVCRGWSAMLSSDYFIDLHRQRANRVDHHRLLLTAVGSSYDGYLYSWQLGDGAVEKLMRDDWLQSVVPLNKPYRGPCSGGYYVVNPCSGEALALPDSQVPFKMAYKTSGWSRRSVEPPCYLRVSYGLGYCTTRKEYKVVLVRLFSDPEPGDGGGGFTPTTCEVFVLGTTGTGYWRPSAERPPMCSVRMLLKSLWIAPVGVYYSAAGTTLKIMFGTGSCKVFAVDSNGGGDPEILPTPEDTIIGKLRG